MDSLGLKDWNCSFILFFFFFFSYSFLLEIQFKERTGEKDKKMEDGGWRMEDGTRMEDEGRICLQVHCPKERWR